MSSAFIFFHKNTKNSSYYFNGTFDDDYIIMIFSLKCCLVDNIIFLIFAGESVNLDGGNDLRIVPAFFF